MSSNSQEKRDTDSYQHILESLKAAEQLEWESTQLKYSANSKRKAISTIFAIPFALALVMILFLIEEYMPVRTGNSIFEVLNNLSLFFFAPIMAVAITAVILAKNMITQAQDIEHDSNYRLKLAIELVQPMRDLLYIKAEHIHLTSQQLQSLKTRLYRFPLDQVTKERGR